MPSGERYEPSSWDWVRNQVDLYERSGGTEGTTFLDTGLPVVILTMRGNRSGKIRKAPVMRVEHRGEYAIVASKGGDPQHPGWYYNLKAHPDTVELQDGPHVMHVTVQEVEGNERAQWWERAVGDYPPLRGLSSGDTTADSGFGGDAKTLIILTSMRA